jgi:hypothetical protein
MAYIKGEGRSQGALFPVMLDDLVPADHMCRGGGCVRQAARHGDAWIPTAEPADTASQSLWRRRMDVHVGYPRRGRRPCRGVAGCAGKLFLKIERPRLAETTRESRGASAAA